MLNRGNVAQGTGYTGDGDYKPNSRQWGNPAMSKSREFHHPLTAETKGGENLSYFGTSSGATKWKFEPWPASPRGVEAIEKMQPKAEREQRNRLTPLLTLTSTSA